MINRSRARQSEAAALRRASVLSIGGTRRFTRTCQPCLQRTYVMLFTSRALLSARFTIFYVTWMDSRFFRIETGRRSRRRDACPRYSDHHRPILSLIASPFANCYLNSNKQPMKPTLIFSRNMDFAIIGKMSNYNLRQYIWNKIIFMSYAECVMINEVSHTLR